jgi:hypothetical protein
VFQHLTLHGGAAALLWGHRTAAELSSWHIARTGAGTWTLSATVARADAFQLRQKPLLFTAPRARGFWAWGVNAIEIAPPYRTLRATLGPPEQ